MVWFFVAFNLCNKSSFPHTPLPPRAPRINLLSAGFEHPSAAFFSPTLLADTVAIVVLADRQSTLHRECQKRFSSQSIWDTHFCN